MTSRPEPVATQVASDTPDRPGFRRAASWSFLMEGGRQSLNVGFTFVLAGILGPEAYGIAAMGLVFVLFVDMLQRQGMAPALIQRKNLTRGHKDTAFWMVVGASCLLCLASVSAAGGWARLNASPELRGVILGLAPIIPMKGLSVVQEALLRRSMAFRDLALRNLMAVSVGGIAGISAALMGWGVWALVAQHLVAEATSATLLWRSSDWRPGLRLSVLSARELLPFSAGAFLSSMASFVNNHADALLIGLFFGPFVVGVYRLGLRLVETTVSAFAGPVQALALPELAPHQGNRGEVRRRVERLMRLAGTTTLPLLGVLAGVAKPIVGLLGSEWSTTAQVVPVLCLVGAIRVLVVADGPLMQALGSPFRQAGFAATTALISAGSFVLAGVYLQGASPDAQALGVAVSRVVVWSVGVLAMHAIILRRFVGLGFVQACSPLKGATSAGVAAALVGGTVTRLLGDAPPIVTLLISGSLAGLVAAWVVWVLVPECREVVRSVAVLLGTRLRPSPDTDR